MVLFPDVKILRAYVATIAVAPKSPIFIKLGSTWLINFQPQSIYFLMLWKIKANVATIAVAIGFWVAKKAHCCQRNGDGGDYVLKSLPKF